MTHEMREKVVIVGSGPAGWTAAVYAARANLDPVVFEGAGSRTMIPGGQLMFTTEVENYPGFPDGVTGPEMMMAFKQQAERFGTRVFSEDIERVDFSTYPRRLYSNMGREIEADAVIIATGANAKWIGVPGEERLARTGGGVSACAVCDGALPFYRDKVLAVVGGGDSAMEEALYLTNFAREVVIIHRRDEFRASKIMAERALESPKIRVRGTRWSPKSSGTRRFVRSRYGHVMTGRGGTRGGRPLRRDRPHAQHRVPGRPGRPQGQRLCRASPSWRTARPVPGVFAAGDVMDDYYRQAVTAAGTGCMAALEAERWLAHGGMHAETGTHEPDRAGR
jgi:thioredoxin reductase (NADPH)